MTRETKVTTELDLAKLVIKEEILERTRENDIEIIDELALCRAREMVGNSHTQIRYSPEINAFTCEICCDRIIVRKHRTLNKAIDFAVSNISEIQVIHRDTVVGLWDKQKLSKCKVRNL